MAIATAIAIAQISRLIGFTIENYISATKILPKNQGQTVDSHVIFLYSVGFQILSRVSSVKLYKVAHYVGSGSIGREKSWIINTYKTTTHWFVLGLTQEQRVADSGWPAQLQVIDTENRETSESESASTSWPVVIWTWMETYLGDKILH